MRVMGSVSVQFNSLPGDEFLVRHQQFLLVPVADRGGADVNLGNYSIGFPDAEPRHRYGSGARTAESNHK